jgi:hypothetical protein
MSDDFQRELEKFEKSMFKELSLEGDPLKSLDEISGLSFTLTVISGKDGAAILRGSIKAVATQWKLSHGPVLILFIDPVRVLKKRIIGVTGSGHNYWTLLSDEDRPDDYVTCASFQLRR